MKLQYFFLVWITIIFALNLYLYAEPQPIGKVTSFSGNVAIKSDMEIKPIIKNDHPVMAGDVILTKEGEAQVTMNDGALIRIRPYSTMMIQEREEKNPQTDTKETTRRVTAFVGKVWLKSGNSAIKNHLQTPTAACGLRGSDADIGFDGNHSFFQQYSGTARQIGTLKVGIFPDPDPTAALKSEIYQIMGKVLAEITTAHQTGDNDKILKALLSLVKIEKEIANQLKAHPDPVVQLDSKLLRKAAQVRYNAAKIRLDVFLAKKTLGQQITPEMEKKLDAMVTQADQTAQNAATAAKNLNSDQVDEADKDMGQTNQAFSSFAQQQGIQLPTEENRDNQTAPQYKLQIKYDNPLTVKAGTTARLEARIYKISSQQTAPATQADQKLLKNCVVRWIIPAVKFTKESPIVALSDGTMGSQLDWNVPTQLPQDTVEIKVELVRK